MHVQINGTISKVQFILSEFYGLDLDITNLSLTNENAILLFFPTTLAQKQLAQC